MTRKQIIVIATRLKEELDNIQGLHTELADRGLTGSKKKIKSVINPGDTFTLRAVGSILHDFYVAAENIFGTIAREIDEKLPAGEHWHRELLMQMILDIPEVRPPVLSRETAFKLDEFRAFRHVFRNVYGFNLSSERMVDLLNKFPHTISCLEKDVCTFIQTMKQIVSE